MPEIQPTGAPYPRSVLGWDGTNWRVMAVDALGHVQVDVVTSGLPAGAATAANQATMITALQLIDDLRGALQSVGSDRLRVRGEDQLFSYKEEYIWNASGLAVGAGHQTLDSNVVAPGEARVLTNAVLYNDTTVNDYVYLASRTGVINWYIDRKVSPVVLEGLSWAGHAYIPAGYLVRGYFRQCAAGDNIYMSLHGYELTLEV